MVPTIHYEFGPFLIDPIRRLLYRDGERVAVAAKPFDLLIELIQAGGMPQSKDTLMQAIWAGTSVLDNTFDVTLSNLRKALGESAKAAQYIVTTPDGYVLAAEVKATIIGQAAESPNGNSVKLQLEAVPSEPQQRAQIAINWWRSTTVAWTFSAAVLALLVASLIYSMRRLPAPVTKAHAPVPVPNIVVDGQPHEWKGIEPLLKDATGDGPFDPFGTYHGRLDFLAISVTNNDKNLYLLLEFAGDYNGGIKIFLDTDLNASTGCHNEDLANGAEYIVFVSLNVPDPGLALADARNCSFKEDYPGAIQSANVGRFVEAAIPLETLRIITPETNGVRIAAEAIAPGKGITDKVGPPTTYIFH